MQEQVSCLKLVYFLPCMISLQAYLQRYVKSIKRRPGGSCMGDWHRVKIKPTATLGHWTADYNMFDQCGPLCWKQTNKQTNGSTTVLLYYMCQQAYISHALLLPGQQGAVTCFMRLLLTHLSVRTQNDVIVRYVKSFSIQVSDITSINRMSLKTSLSTGKKTISVSFWKTKCKWIKHAAWVWT